MKFFSLNFFKFIIIKKNYLFFLKNLTSVLFDYPLNLSISLSGGKETNRDSLSNGERTGKKFKLKIKFILIINLSCSVRSLPFSKIIINWIINWKVSKINLVQRGWNSRKLIIIFEIVRVKWFLIFIWE